jgi:citrate lyase subunit beta/citryl-CoA lyase
MLYVPANNENFVAKAHLRGADAVVLDLEDSVLPEHKAFARENLDAAVKSAGQLNAPVFVRINADEANLELDLNSAIAANATALFLPKISIRSLSRVEKTLGALERGNAKVSTSIIGLIEDAESLISANEIAKSDRILGLALGSEDFATSIGADPVPGTLKYPKLLLHYAAKANGKMSFGLFRSVTDYNDVCSIEAAAAEAKSHGFDGATCVHPNAVTALNKGFSPTSEDVAWAKRLIAGSKNITSGAFVFEGKMVDAPVLERARKILATANHDLI